jgi:hypothetical protein
MKILRPWLLAFVGVTGIVRVASHVRQTRPDSDPQWRTRQALLRFMSPAVGYAIALFNAMGERRADGRDPP